MLLRIGEFSVQKTRFFFATLRLAHVRRCAAVGRWRA
jgi:hypothetical protein